MLPATQELRGRNGTGKDLCVCTCTCVLLNTAEAFFYSLLCLYFLQVSLSCVSLLASLSLYWFSSLVWDPWPSLILKCEALKSHMKAPYAWAGLQTGMVNRWGLGFLLGICNFFSPCGSLPESKQFSQIGTLYLLCLQSSN